MDAIVEGIGVEAEFTIEEDHFREEILYPSACQHLNL